MKLSNILVALVPLATTSAFVLETRNALLVHEDLKALNGYVHNLNNFVNKISKTSGPTGDQLLPLVEKSNNVSTAIQKATNDTNASPHANEMQSRHLFKYVNNTLAPSTIALLQNFIEHEAGFQNASLNGAVAVVLGQQQQQTANLTAALIKKSAADWKARGERVGDKIQRKFNATIAAYGGPPS